MNKTTNYQLNQWVKDDQVRMEDFNADNAKIDAAIKAVADARSAGDAALSARVDGLSTQKADASALSALSQTVAQERIHVGSFVGDGTENRVIQLPWVPKLVILFGKMSDSSYIGFLAAGHFHHVEKIVYLFQEGNISPKLSGSKLIFPNPIWYNGCDNTTQYILFR